VPGAPASPEVATVDAPASPQASPAPEHGAESKPDIAPILTRQQQGLRYGIASHIGRSRENNEDACYGMHWHCLTTDNRPDFGLFAVADGMGGHLHGELAAGIAVRTLASEVLASLYVPLLRDFDSTTSPTVLEALTSAANVANRAVLKQVRGGGTTLSAVAMIGNLAYVIHVGDSRAYLIGDRGIEQLTTDHTLVQRLLDMQEISASEAESYPQKNVLYRALGQSEELRLERFLRPLPSAVQILLCTDGLWDELSPAELQSIAQAAQHPQAACEKMISLANERGGSDNISVILIQAPGGGALP